MDKPQKDEIIKKPVKSRLVKGSDEAKEYMASIRLKKLDKIK